ncbi:MAG: type II toxin-antitoxin system RelE/ParE family toxin [Kiritimatiellae bacterium]|nr:type II toxin-antitoxin system RelE/ParE family toxin [Kiritimatiellia bacterium]
MKKQIVITLQAQEFIFAQPIPVIDEIMRTIKELETNGRLTVPAAKKISGEDNLFEIRVKVSANQYRVFYCYAIENRVYVLNGFVKMTRKTPEREIRKAKRIMKGLGI